MNRRTKMSVAGLFACLLVHLLAGCAAVKVDVVSVDQPLAGVYEIAAPKAKIFSVSKQWLAENFRSAKAVLEYENAEEGTVIGNASIPYACADLSTWTCSTQARVLKIAFTMRMDAKDNRFRLQYSNLRVVSENGSWVEMERADYAVAKQRLLGLGDQLAARIGQQGASQAW